MQLWLRHDAPAPVPIIATLPHSGLFVPPEIAARFHPTHAAWLRNSDWHLGQVYDFLPALGITVLEATHSRYVADLNRRPVPPLLGDFFRAVVAERTAHGAPVYVEPPTADELALRVAEIHAPFHRELAALLASHVARFSRVLLLDLHSFMGPITNEVCLGDAHGATCAATTTASIGAALRDNGFDVVVNAPFTGGHVIRAHAAPPAIEALQIELRYTTYLDCARIDEPEIPAADPARIALVQRRLRPAFEAIVSSLG